MSDPMSGVAMYLDGDLCPPLLSEIVRRILKARGKGPKDPRPLGTSDRYDDLYVSLAMHQLSLLMVDKKAAAGIQKIALGAIERQVQGL